MASVETRLEENEEVGAPSDQVVRLENQLARLESLYVEGDPTIRLETKAAVPSDPVSPRPALTIVAGIIGGLVLGIGGAFLIQAVDPRLRREDQLRDVYSLPVLARIPNDSGENRWVPRFGGRRRRSAPLGPSSLSPQTFEAFRTLRAMLNASRSEDLPEEVGSAIMVTGASPVEGKTTTAINLAASYALAGKRVILIEADFRRPTVSAALGVTPSVGIGDVLLQEVDLTDALVRVEPFGGSLKLLPVQRPDAHLSELLSMPAARRLLDETRAMADCVIIDSPPLTEVADTLPVAQLVDDLLIVCRVGRSSLSQLSRLADLLEQNDIKPRGFVLVGVAASPEGGYYLQGSGMGPRLGPEDPEAGSSRSGPPRRATRR
jgi:receptor protein-tyrosine kinase